MDIHFFGKLEIKKLLHFLTYVFIKKFTDHACPPGDDICRSVTGTYFEAWFPPLLNRAFFNYITGGGGKAPQPPWCPPLNHFGPPSQSRFSLKYKQNMEFRRFDILVTEICFVNLMSCLLSLMLNIVL
jgi:hypothetical protein